MCSNKECRQVLGSTDGDKIIPIRTDVLSNKLSDKKKKFNPLYCVSCGHITRIYKKKFQSKIKKKEKFIRQIGNKKAG